MVTDIQRNKCSPRATMLNYIIVALVIYTRIKTTSSTLITDINKIKYIEYKHIVTCQSKKKIEND